MTVNSPDTVETYLDLLRERAPPTTVYSQKNCLLHLTEWCDCHNVRLIDLNPVTVAEFILEQNTAGFSNVTTDGYVSTAANFLAYFKSIHPQITVNITRSEIEPSSVESESDLVAVTVDEIRNYLSTCANATRAHAYVELLNAIVGPATQTQKLNVPDIDFDGGLIKVPVTDKFLVGKIGLVDSCEQPLPGDTEQVVENYLSSHRISPTQSGAPLLTTSRGRASQTTLTRDVKEAGEKAARFHQLERRQQQCTALQEFIADRDRPPLPREIAVISESSQV